MAKRNILVLCQHYYPEMVSTGSNMTELCSGLSKVNLDNNITVFCSMPGKEEFKNDSIPKTETYKGVKIVRVTSIGSEHKGILSRLVFGLSFFIKAFFYTIKNRKKFNLFVSTTNPPFIGVVAAFVKRFFGKPYLLIVHDIYPDIPVALSLIKDKSIVARFWRAFNKNIYKSVDKAVVLGDDMKEIMARKIDVNKLVKIPNWSDSRNVFPIEDESNRFIKMNPLLKDKTILLYSGNMGRTHNIEHIVNASEKLQDLKNVIFVFIGGGNKKQYLESYVEEHNPTNILMLPYQPYDILGDVLSSATLSFVCLENDFTGLSVPSKSYGIMASGTPLVGILDKRSEIAQTIIKHKCGIVFDPEKDKFLSDTLRSLLKNKPLIAEYAKNALNAFTENFDLKVSVKKYDNNISEILSKIT